jgi:hypothetical protein
MNTFQAYPAFRQPAQSLETNADENYFADSKNPSDKDYML